MNSPLLTVVRSLNFQEDRREMLRDMPASAWPALLHLPDEARLTLALGIRCSSALPPGVQERVAESLTKNIERHARIVADWREIAEMLRGRGVEFIVLKGLTHWPYYADDPA